MLSVLGFGLILMIPAIRTTKSNLAWQVINGFPTTSTSSSSSSTRLTTRWELFFFLMVYSDKNSKKRGLKKKCPNFSFSDFQPSLGLHEEVAIHLCLSAQLHQLCCTVSVLLGGVSYHFVRPKFD